jgi:hypothetical protein
MANPLSLITKLFRHNKGFERIGGTGDVKIEMMQLYPEKRDQQNEVEDGSLYFECWNVTEFSDITRFPAFDYGNRGMTCRREDKLCYVVDRSLSNYALMRVTEYSYKYGIIDGDVVDVDMDVLKCHVIYGPTDYPTDLPGDVPEESTCEIYARDDSAFFKTIWKEFRRRKFSKRKWEKIGIFAIPANVVAYVCARGIPTFLKEAGDDYSIDDLVRECVNQQRAADRMNEKNRIIIDSDDSDSEAYSDIKRNISKEYNTDEIFRISSVHTWYRLPYWTLTMVNKKKEIAKSPSIAPEVKEPESVHNKELI